MELLAPVSLDARDIALMTASLAVLSATCVSLYVVRVVHTRELRYLFVTGNLTLAWVPLGFAVMTQWLHGASLSGRPILGPAALVLWALFLPNAPYVVTDLQHYRSSTLIQGWYDAAFLGTFAITGMLAGLVSLYIMQSVAADLFGAIGSWAFVLVVFPLTGFGIYLGRVLRWNSWDALIRPGPLLLDVVQIARYPGAYREAYAVAAVFAVLMASTYAVLLAIRAA